MALQSRINAEISAAQVGKTIRVIVDSPGKARSWMDAPEVDGVVHVDPSLAVGSFVDVVIQEARGYDLIATGAQVGSD
ncbi:MAG: Ribosomal protein S12 methylthiotransferase RimO [Verrucomicrobia bacterium ADurb.Bin474]|nr:MAG: Ribosomal protein S12 methylthiotransferase RimO [Verrucomicrobia bacterium ADurb.Bin474]